MLSPKAFAGKRYFVFLKPLYEMTFVHSFHKGERGSYEDQLVILVSPTTHFHRDLKRSFLMS